MKDSRRFYKFFKYLSHYPRIRDKIKLFISLFIIVVIPARLRRTRRIFRKVFSFLFRGSNILIDNGCIFKIVDLDSVYIVNPEYEEWIHSYMKPIVGDIFLDVGAHIGKYSIYFGRKGISVIAIEPSKLNFDFLVSNITLNNTKRDIKPINIAAWDKDTILFYEEGSISMNTYISKESDKTHQVKAKLLDDILCGECINWIKIDIEGAELEALIGLERTIKKWNPKIVVEVRKKTEDNVTKYLKTLNYKVKTIFSDGGDSYYFSERQ